MSASTTSHERIWYEDPIGLFKGDRIARFLPEAHAPLTQQLNAIMRFAVYFSVLMFFVGRRVCAMYSLVLAAAGTAAMNLASQADMFQDARGPEERETSSARPPACSRPTLDNPFGNVMLSDYSTEPDRPPACDLQDPAVADEVEGLFEHNLYRDVSDALHRASSSRQFYTNPSTTIPNDQGAFARWCYMTGPGCKEGNGDRCDTNTFRALPGR